MPLLIIYVFIYSSIKICLCIYLFIIILCVCVGVLVGVLPSSAAMTTQPRFMTDCEIRLALQWYHEDGVAVEEIGRRLRRNKTCILGTPAG